ncbi:MAG: YIP1 family protein [candidate division Zixibacteria bacterium]|nr:YIP1 family protein [candidate division Zixibacteria bacterium]
MNMEPATATPQKSIWGIIGDVFFSPIEAFEAFKQKPTIWVPLILMIVMASAAGFFTAEQTTMDQYEMMKTSTLPAPILEQMRQDAQNPNAILAAIGPAIAVPIFSILSALLAWFIGGFLLGGKSKFMDIWGVGLLAGLIPMVGGLIRIPMAIAKGTAQVSIGPAALMQQTDYVSVLGIFFYFADVFAIWSLVVLSFGYSIIFGISRGKGAAVTIITWLVMVALAMTMMLIGMSFAGVDIRFM